MKNVLFFIVLFLITCPTSAVPTGYVDLGLPSGTLWNDSDENGFYTYDEAAARFGSSLPTKEQLDELASACQWIWSDSCIHIIGPSGDSIMPIAGSRDCHGYVEHIGSYGSYWSVTPEDSVKAWYLYFRPREMYVNSKNRCHGRCVRLVR